MFNRLYIYWWALNKKDGTDNYGDILAPFIASKLSHKKIVRVTHPMKRKYRFFLKHYVTVGSIIWSVGPNSIVWGSGIIKQNENVRKAKFVAVRGPRTRKRLLELDYEVPEVYGDPALLMPDFIPNTTTKKYELGIIPHYVDYAEILKKFKNSPEVKVINLMTDDIVKTTHEILECKSVISSSLHGVILSHTYRIPAVWVRFSNKLAGDNVKFYDYFESVNLDYKSEYYIAPEEITKGKLLSLLSENSAISLPTEEIINFRKKQLIDSCPFKK